MESLVAGSRPLLSDLLGMGSENLPFSKCGCCWCCWLGDPTLRASGLKLNLSVLGTVARAVLSEEGPPACLCVAVLVRAAVIVCSMCAHVRPGALALQLLGACRPHRRLSQVPS